MSGDVHVRFCKRLGVKFPRPTYPKLKGRIFEVRETHNQTAKIEAFVSGLSLAYFHGAGKG
jgi:hypothetical protein